MLIAPGTSQEARSQNQDDVAKIEAEQAKLLQDFKYATKLYKDGKKQILKLSYSVEGNILQESLDKAKAFFSFFKDELLQINASMEAVEFKVQSLQSQVDAKTLARLRKTQTQLLDILIGLDEERIADLAHLQDLTGLVFKERVINDLMKSLFEYRVQYVEQIINGSSLPPARKKQLLEELLVVTKDNVQPLQKRNKQLSAAFSKARPVSGSVAKLDREQDKVANLYNGIDNWLADLVAKVARSSP